MTYREDIGWRTRAHEHGRSTSLDGIPAPALRLIHILWRIQDTFFKPRDNA